MADDPQSLSDSDLDDLILVEAHFTLVALLTGGAIFIFFILFFNFSFQISLVIGSEVDHGIPTLDN